MTYTQVVKTLVTRHTTHQSFIIGLSFLYSTHTKTFVSFMIGNHGLPCKNDGVFVVAFWD